MTYEKALEQINELLKYAATLDTDDLDFDFNETVAFHMVCKNALEKQIPKKVIEKPSDYFYLGDQYCPSCKEYVGFKQINHDKFCNNCGQALDWGD